MTVTFRGPKGAYEAVCEELMRLGLTDEEDDMALDEVILDEDDQVMSEFRDLLAKHKLRVSSVEGPEDHPIGPGYGDAV